MPRLEKELLINWFKKGEKNREDWKKHGGGCYRGGGGGGHEVEAQGFHGHGGAAHKGARKRPSWYGGGDKMTQDQKGGDTDMFGHGPR